MRLLTIIGCAALGLTVGAVQAAQPVLIEGVKLVSASYRTDPAVDVLLRDGRIAAIGPQLSLPIGARAIDGSGRVLAPGFFNSETHMGLTEVNSVPGTRDEQSENDRVSAALRVSDAINPHSTLIPHNRMLGLTHALVQPESKTNLFAGTAAVIQMADQDTVINSAAGVVVTLGAQGSKLAGGSRAVSMALLRAAVEDARDYAANRAAVNAGRRRDYSLSRQDLAALAPVIRGDIPLIAHASRAHDIEQIVRFAGRNKLKLIVSGAQEAWRVADLLAERRVPVIIDPIQNLPTAYEAIGTRLDNAALLHSAGVTLLFTGMGWQNTHNAFLVRQSAGNSVANGLPYMAAINAISRNPARVFGVAGYGELKVGSEASVVLWSGDPLEMSSSVEAVFIKGEPYALQSRATRLRDRYWARYGTSN